MEEENLRDSLWFKQLTKMHKKTCVQAAKNGYFIAIPQTCSLTTTVVTQKDIDNHVLQPQQTRGEFLTLSNKKVIMSGTEARTDAGFKVKVVSKVLSAQTIPLEVPDGKGGTLPSKLHVYHISRPFEGGIEGHSSLDELSPTAISQYLGMLRSMPEAEEAFYTVTAAIKDSKKTLEARDGTPCEGKVALVQSKLRLAIDSATSELLGCSLYDGEASDKLEIARRQIFLCLESYATEQLHVLLIDALRKAKAEQTADLAHNVDSHTQDSLEALQISPKFRCDYNAAIDKLALVLAAPTPLQKLHRLRDITTEIVSCVERSLEKKGVDLSDIDLGADDVLSILTHVLIQAHLRGCIPGSETTYASDLPVQLAFIQRFRQAGSGPLDKSHLGYIFANIGQALGFFGADAGPEEIW